MTDSPEFSGTGDAAAGATSLAAVAPTHTTTDFFPTTFASSVPPGIRTLCNRLALQRQAARGSIEECPGYLVVRTPESPTFWFGNYILVRDRLESGSLPLWESRFASAFGPECGHRLFIVDTPDGNPGPVEDFREAGYDLDLTRSMVFRVPSAGWRAESVPRPELLPEELDDAGMEELLAIAIETQESDPKPGVNMDFLCNQSRLHRNLVRMDTAKCFALRIEGRLAASVLYIIAGREALIENVQTIPMYRRQGLCRTLLLRSMERLVARGIGLFALEPVDSYAEMVYRRLGFTEGDYLCDVLRHPGTVAGTVSAASSEAVSGLAREG